MVGSGNVDPRSVEWRGNHNLIQAARAARAEHFILVSVHGAGQNAPIELSRMKHRAERELQASGLAWTILRPTVFMETWAGLVGEPLLRSGKTRLFGRGENPVNFVSVEDAARFVELAVVDPALRGTIVEVGGPENLTLKQFVQTIEKVSGKPRAKSHVPLAMMRIMAVALRPVNGALARQIEAGVATDTTDMTLDPSELRRCFPSLPQTVLADVIRRDYLHGA